MMTDSAGKTLDLALSQKYVLPYCNIETHIGEELRVFNAFCPHSSMFVINSTECTISAVFPRGKHHGVLIWDHQYLGLLRFQFYAALANIDADSLGKFLIQMNMFVAAGSNLTANKKYSVATLICLEQIRNAEEPFKFQMQQDDFDLAGKLAGRYRHYILLHEIAHLRFRSEPNSLELESRMVNTLIPIAVDYIRNINLPLGNVGDTVDWRAGNHQHATAFEEFAPLKSTMEELICDLFAVIRLFEFMMTGDIDPKLNATQSLEKSFMQKNSHGTDVVETSSVLEELHLTLRLGSHISSGVGQAKRLLITNKVEPLPSDLLSHEIPDNMTDSVRGFLELGWRADFRAVLVLLFLGPKALNELGISKQLYGKMLGEISERVVVREKKFFHSRALPSKMVKGIRVLIEQAANNISDSEWLAALPKADIVKSYTSLMPKFEISIDP